MKSIVRLFESRRFSRRFFTWLAFLCALAAYLLTLEPDASYWDCPEYLVTAALLEIGHPPGNPFWTLTARIFSLFGGSDPQAIAVAVNISSALFTALAAGLLASVIFLLLSRLNLFHHVDPLRRADRRRRSMLRNVICGLAAWSGALCFGWADSPWFSAIEAEVYAMSLFLTALSVRLMVGWSFMPSGPASRRQLLLIVYLTGLSIGVHQLNLLVIPALALIWLFRRYPARRVGAPRILLALLLGCAAVGILLLGMMPGVLKAAAAFELHCVNSLHWPVHSGVWAFWGFAIAICWSIPFCIPSRFGRLQLLAWMPAMLLTGYSCYMMLLIRGAAEPPMNEGAPTNIFALQSYLGRDQYGSTPLFYGRTPKSPILRRETINAEGQPDYSRNALRDGDPHYALTDSGYILFEHARIPVYAPELNMWLPRLTSQDPADIEAYADWAGMTQQSMTPVEVSYALDSLDNPVGRLNPDGSRTRDTELRPTYLQQLRYLLAYQMGYMYFRYLLWNYSGRQNDRFAVGEVEHGNFITGFPFVDNLMLGKQEAMPDEIGKDNPGRNIYFMLPLIIGILGIFLLQDAGRRGRRANLVILILFLMTGIAIVVYLNQSPRQPRERDYSFLGSLWAYAIWIGCGMAMLMRGALSSRLCGRKLSHKLSLKARRKLRKILLGATLAVAIGIPVMMLAQNYDDHDRSGRRAVTDFAANLLESLEPNAILFTNGDNFTFPLWWAQEVAGVRRDVTIINTAYLATPWYIEQLRRDGRGAPGLKMHIPADELALGGFKFSSYNRDPDLTSPSLDSLDARFARDALSALRDFYAADPEKRRLPARLLLKNPEGSQPIVIPTSAVASGSSSLGLRQLATLDILASNAASAAPRPVYWQSSLGSGDFGGVYPLTSRMLLSRRLVYADSLEAEKHNKFLSADLRKAFSTRSGRTPNARRSVYADDTYGYMLTTQRQALLRFGGRLLKAGRPADALRIARLTDSIFPPEIHEYNIFAEADSIIDEGADLARLYLEAARRIVGDSPSALAADSDYQRGLAILSRERRRYSQWRRFYEELPPRLRLVMTPRSLRKTQRLPQIDSLINRYK